MSRLNRVAEDAMTKKADAGKRDTVEWKWGSGKGGVTKVHTSDVTRTIEGSSVKRTASKEEPAVEVTTAKGAKVLKSTSEGNVK